MARIPINSLPNQLNSGEQTFSPAQFRIQENFSGQALAGTAKQLINLKLSMDSKAKAVDDLTLRLQLEQDIADRTLEFTKWQQANLDKPDEWENKSIDYISALNGDYADRPMSDETRFKIGERLQNFSNNFRAQAYSDGLKTKSNNFSTQLETEKNRAVTTGDFSTYDVVLDEAGNQGLYSSAQIAAFKQERNTLILQKAKEDTVNMVKSYVDANQFDLARAELLQAKNANVISDTEFQAEDSRITYKFEYNNKMEALSNELNANPAKVLKDINQSESTRGVTTGVDAVSFIKDQEGFEPVAKWDAAQFSVGYGTRGVEGESLTKEQADARLRKELDMHAKRVDDIAAKNNITLNPNQRAALISYDFNTGKVEGVFSRAKGDPNKLADGIRNGIKTSEGKYMQGLADRRNREADLAASKVSASTASGPLGWVATNDRFNIKVAAEKELATRATKELDTFKQAVDIGQIALSTDPTAGTADEQIENILNSPQFSQLNNSELKQVAKSYSLKLPGNFEATQVDIMKYDPVSDPSGLKNAQLQARINGLFEGTYKDTLTKNLKDNSENALISSENRKLAPAFSLLNTLAFTDQALGEYKTAKTVPQQVTIKPVDWLPDWEIFGAEFGIRDVPMVTTPDIEVQLPDGTIKKIKSQAKQVEEVDPEKRAEIAILLEQRKEELRAFIKQNPNISSDQLLKKVPEFIRQDIKISAPSSSASPVPNIDIKKASDAVKRAQQQVK